MMSPFETPPFRCWQMLPRLVSLCPNHGVVPMIGTSRHLWGESVNNDDVRSSFYCVLLLSAIPSTDTPQFRRGNPYFFRENPYQSVSFIYASVYSENVHAIHITIQVPGIKNRQPAAKNQNRSLLHVVRQSE